MAAGCFEEGRVMKFAVYSLFAIAFFTTGLVEIKTGKAIIRKNATRENGPIFYWAEVLVSFLIAGLLMYFAMVQLSGRVGN